VHTITDSTHLSESVVKTVVEAPEIARKRRAGQFVILMIDDHGERIPLTIVDSDPVAGTITLIYQIVGRSTADLAELGTGDVIEHILGPLGQPTEVDDVGSAVCVGGGVGIGVLYPITAALTAHGTEVVAVLGARSRDLLILEEETRKVVDELVVTTDDGSYGRHGFVTDALAELIDSGRRIDRVYAIGPVPMMRAIAEVTRPHGIPTVVSLNPIMVDGTGMCGGCRVSVDGHAKFACVDGPEFDGHLVDFDLMSKRLRAYVPEERQAMASGGCRAHA
jgi:ferredoxin--NADP+ reductase